ncbi:hypothetical protein [Anatilimnocola floriformis]|uniref:hypothetical protein n=1 Tax=Anatilimnocola floriformis TaxID=2948575 RepID=UPI0020C23EB2|nr:hypothetical protein [Anatilimnocola floriformis]
MSSFNDVASRNTEFDLNVPQHAAWVFGRLIHKLEHFMQVTWLTCNPIASETVSHVFSDLRLASRGLYPDEVSRMRLVNLIREVEELWITEIASEWHADFLFDAETRLRNENQNCGGFSRHFFETLCQQLLAGVSDLLAMLRNTVLDSVSNELIGCLNFAESVDQAIHPLPAYRYLSCAEQVEVAQLGWEAQQSGRDTIPRQLPQLPVRIEAIPQQFWKEVSLRWRQLGLPADSLPSACQTLAPAATAELIAMRFSAVYADGDSQPAETQTRAIEPSDRPESVDLSLVRTSTSQTGADSETRHHLGLRLEGRLLYRQGYIEPVVLRSRLGRKLMQAFIDRGKNCLDYSELSSLWGGFGGNADMPEESSIRSQLCRLRKQIRPLEVMIDGAHGGSWALEDDTTVAQAL